MALAYIIRRFFHRIADFLRHWYVKSAKIYFNFVLDKLSKIDRVLAWRVNLKYVFHPLYQDYSIVGYSLGFVTRILRFLGTSAIYAVLFSIAILVYVAWLLVPIFIILKIFTLNV
jgi:hypothetical protein